jgi:serine/threonine-protein kinase
MTPERWKLIDQLFHAALQREPGRRAAFVAESCAGDETLQKEIEDLLVSHDQSESFIETSAADVAAELLAEDKPGLAAGQAVGPYKVVNLLGEGGMGQVFLGTDTRLGRPVALKVLPRQFTIDPERVRRFEQEARAASALNHPNIVTIHEIGRFNGTRFIVTEFVEGQTLRQLMNEKPLTLNEALNVAIQIAGALSAAHGAGIVHRDIKPENIMLRADGYVKILDFGLAKLTELRTDSEREGPTLLQSNPGLVMGTVQYMSPEQARGETVDARTDIWSLGALLYELICGHVPFSGETPSHVMVSLMETELPPLTNHTNVPAELERIVTKALRKNRKERYQTSKELAHDLENLKQELQIEARLKGSLQPQADSKERTASRDRREGFARTPAARTVDIGVAHPTSSAEYLVTEIKRRKVTAMFASALLIVAVAATAYFFYFRGLAAGETIDSVAVLPFVNVNNDATTEYLSDGLSDSIIDKLTKLPNLKRVIAFSSVLRYKGKQTDPQAVGHELNVRAVFIGRLTQRGDDLLISTELVDVKDNKRLWGGQYNLKSGDVFKLQGEIAQEITDRLRLRLTGGEKQRLAKRETDNPEAYQLYLKGRFLRRNRVSNQEAISYLEQAIKLDPNFAAAYAQIAYAYNSTSMGTLPPPERRAKWEAAVTKGLEIDNANGDLQASLAQLRREVQDWAGYEKGMQHALELDPNSADIHAFYARGLWSWKRFDEAILHMRRAQELDPLSPALCSDLGKILYSAGQREQAFEQYRKTLELNPNYPDAHHHLANYYLAQGKYDEATAEAVKAESNSSGEPTRSAQLGYLYAVTGKRAEAQKILHELEELSKQRHVNPFDFALIYTGLGDKDRAFEYLQKQLEENARSLVFIQVTPEWDSLRSDPRYAELLRRLKFIE